MKQKKGWILIEYAVILSVMGILFVTISIGYTRYKEKAERDSAIERLSQLKDAINHFAAINGRLPNVAKYVTNSDANYGLEMLVAGGDTVCSSNYCINNKVAYGLLPNVTLGIQSSKLCKDAKDNEISYIINFDLTDVTKFKERTHASNIEIKDEQEDVILNQTIMGGVAYVLVWHGGKKKYGAYNSKDNITKNACPAVTATDDVGENCNFLTASDLNFIHRTKLNAPDFIVWESHANLQSAFLRKKT